MSVSRVRSPWRRFEGLELEPWDDLSYKAALDGVGLQQDQGASDMSGEAIGERTANDGGGTGDVAVSLLRESRNADRASPTR